MIRLPTENENRASLEFNDSQASNGTVIKAVIQDQEDQDEIDILKSEEFKELDEEFNERISIF